MAIYQLDEDIPQIAASAWIADSAEVMGRVHVGERSSVWFNTVIRADNESIRIGDESNIQDGTVLHCDPGKPLNIGRGVTVGHQVMLHGCTIGEGSLIGMGATILNGAKIGKHCLVGAHAFVGEGKEFPDYSLIVGAPARVIRTIDEDNAKRIRLTAEGYVRNYKRFSKGLKPLD
mgnify:CR=1 FL=1